MKTIKNNCSAGIRIMSAAWKRQVMSDEIEWFQSPIISICASLPLFIYCSRAVIAVSNFAMPARINAIKKNWHHLKTKLTPLSL